MEFIQNMLFFTYMISLEIMYGVKLCIECHMDIALYMYFIDYVD